MVSRSQPTSAATPSRRTNASREIPLNVGGAEDMPGVAVFKTQPVVRPGLASFAVDRERLAQPAMLPAIRRPVRLAMGEERVNDADFFALAGHDVDRIVQERVADGGGRFGHENSRLRLLPHENRERADVIEVRVGKKQRIDRQARQIREKRQSHFPLFLRVHAAIQDHPLPARTEIITIGADLSPACQIDELQNRAATCQSRAREQSANLFPGSPPPATTRNALR